MMKVPVRRRAFTLIEVLTVIAIIAVLASITINLTGYVARARRETKARAEIAMMTTKLEEFKALYGEYPMPEAANEATCEATLFNALTGRWIYVRNDLGQLVWDKTRVGANTGVHAFIDVGTIGTNVDPDNAGPDAAVASRFVDPWGNNYRYRYGVITAGKPALAWNSPGFLLISAGDNFGGDLSEKEGGVVADAEFFDADDAASGIIDADYYNGSRNDNLSNFGRR